MSDLIIILLIVYALGAAAAFALGLHEGESAGYVLFLAAIWPLIFLAWVAIIALSLLEIAIIRLQRAWRRWGGGTK